MMTSDEIVLLIDDVEKEIATQRNSLDLLMTRKNELEMELMALGETIRKARHTIMSMRARKEKLTRDYWSSKGR